MSEGRAMFGERNRVGFWKSDGFARPKMGGGDDWLSQIVGKARSEMLQRALLETIEAELPSVFDHVDEKWTGKPRKLVIEYVGDLRFRKTSYFGFSTCRICGKPNGAADFSDGTWEWPEGFAHYLSEHGVKPPDRFIHYVLTRSKK